MPKNILKNDVKININKNSNNFCLDFIGSSCIPPWGSCPLIFSTSSMSYFLFCYLFQVIDLWWWLLLYYRDLFKGLFFEACSFIFIYTYTKVTFLGECSFISYLFVNICAPLHDCYIFTCHKILDKKLQETFVLVIRNDESKRWLNRKLFLPQALPPTTCFTHWEDKENSGKSSFLN